MQRLIEEVRALQRPRKDYFTIPEAAEELTISESQLRKLVKDGELPRPVKIASSTRYTREQLDGIRQTLMVRVGFTNF